MIIIMHSSWYIFELKYPVQSSIICHPGCILLEPTSFTPPINISANVLASDFEDLKQLLEEMNYPHPFLAGPDVAFAGQYIHE